MKLYHGSKFIIETPELAKGKSNNDYGRGFYCTEDLEMAREWAAKGKEPPAYVNQYDLDLTGLTVIDLSKEPYTILNWIAVILAHRTFQLALEVAVQVRDYLLANFLPPTDAADVVIGHRADDSYFNYAETFVENGLSLARLNEALRLGRLGLQVALRTEKAFSQLSFVTAEAVSWENYHARYVVRDSAARTEWREKVKVGTPLASDVFAYDIIRRELVHGSAGLREILPS